MGSRRVVTSTWTSHHSDYHPPNPPALGLQAQAASSPGGRGSLRDGGSPGVRCHYWLLASLCPKPQFRGSVHPETKQGPLQGLPDLPGPTPLCMHPGALSHRPGFLSTHPSHG